MSDRESLDTSVAQTLHEALLSLPWVRSGMRLDWNALSHCMIMLSEFSENEVTAFLHDCPVGRRNQLIALVDRGSPPLLCATDDAFRNFDEILQGPGFLFGVEVEDGHLVSPANFDLVEYDGGDRLRFLLRAPSFL